MNDRNLLYGKNCSNSKIGHWMRKTWPMHCKSSTWRRQLYRKLWTILLMEAAFHSRNMVSRRYMLHDKINSIFPTMKSSIRWRNKMRICRNSLNTRRRLSVRLKQVQLTNVLNLNRTFELIELWNSAVIWVVWSWFRPGLSGIK